MAKEKFSRGAAVSDGLETPSDKATLVIVLTNAATGEQAIWRRANSRADPDPINTSNAWLPTFLSWNVGGSPRA